MSSFPALVFISDQRLSQRSVCLNSKTRVLLQCAQLSPRSNKVDDSVLISMSSQIQKLTNSVRSGHTDWNDATAVGLR